MLRIVLLYVIMLSVLASNRGLEQGILTEGRRITTVDFHIKVAYYGTGVKNIFTASN